MCQFERSENWREMRKSGILERNMNINFRRLSRLRYGHTVLWSVVASTLVVVTMSGLARAAKNFNAALTQKPDVALYLLLPEEEITSSTMLRDQETERDYLAETKDGPKLITLKRGPTKWYVGSIESLRGENGRDAKSAEGTGTLHE